MAVVTVEVPLISPPLVVETGEGVGVVEMGARDSTGVSKAEGGSEAMGVELGRSREARLPAPRKR